MRHASPQLRHATVQGLALLTNSRITELFFQRTVERHTPHYCEYSNFEAQKACFHGLKTVQPDRRPFWKFTGSMPIWYLKRPENCEDRRTGPGIFFWRFGTLEKASGVKNWQSDGVSAVPTALAGGPDRPLRRF
ncbi:hypothetical protein JCGZ_01678 [Jatropha curcas]|uniref:Uncharacterized protein n=1 Tax=Jatropha curcas TaxID=180498 RepID=A0A067JJN8_JATCU|nr:hypothetical protein JCGZ_01678 [Jatropha curcas]